MKDVLDPYLGEGRVKCPGDGVILSSKDGTPPLAVAITPQNHAH